MKILLACEFTGTVRRAMRELGHDAWSCDLLPATDGDSHHFVRDVREILSWNWDLMIAFPPCTHLAVSGAHRFKTKEIEQRLALYFVQELLDAPIEKIALENPVGVISSRIRKPDQIIQPYEYGHDASKRTCLWLKNLPKLRGTRYIEPRMVNGKPRWGNQTDSGQNRETPSPDRWKIRSATYAGIARAMADQWGHGQSSDRLFS